MNRNSIIDLLKYNARLYGNLPAVFENGKEYTWGEIDRLSDAYAGLLMKQDIRPGSHVGIMDHNTVHWMLAFFALRKLGCTATLFNGRYAERELKEIMALSGTEHICLGKAVKRDLNPEVAALAEADQKTFLNQPEEAELNGKTAAGDSYLPAVYEDANRITCFIFTTGSTARPKCVMLSDDSLLANAEAMAETMRYSENDRICVSTPFFHIFSLVCNLLGALLSRAEIILPESIKSAGLIDCIAARKCTVFNGVPTSFLAMTANAGFSREKVKSVRTGTLGGAKVNLSQMKELRGAFPAAELMINYGSTEAGFVCNTDEGDSLEIVSCTVGKEMKHMQVAVADLNTGDLLTDSSCGEILVKGRGLMEGYYGLPEQEQAIDENGYLHTGDIGFVDADGRLHITDRIKNIIIRGGENISPSEIESVIAGYPPVRDVVVLGVPQKVLGEEPVAFLTIKPGTDFREEELRELLSEKLADFKIPRKILLMERFPVTANGKKDMLALRQMAAE